MTVHRYTGYMGECVCVCVHFRLSHRDIAVEGVFSKVNAFDKV